jgi:hypothetical protein
MQGINPLRLVVGGLACAAVVALFAAAPSLLPADDAEKSSPAKANEAASPQSAAKPAEKPKAVKEPKEAAEPIEPADNSYCLVCHLNYENEKLARKHQIAGVGCAKCHGQSEKHSGDEDGLTAPDIIYAHEDVNKFCMTCHPQEKLAKSKNHKELMPAILAGQEKPKADKQPTKAGRAAGKLETEDRLVCTECHGENHRMEVRTRKWDKKTRKLISDDGVRMMYKNSPATEGVKASKKKP